MDKKLNGFNDGKCASSGIGGVIRGLEELLIFDNENERIEVIKYLEKQCMNGNIKDNKLINYSEASRMLTGDRTAIRSTYNRPKHKEAVNELREFEKAWTEKYDRQKSQENTE